jgi:Uma2 family endonuclease
MGAHPATASPLVHRYTLEEFWQLEAPPGGGHYELIAGVLYVVPPPTLPHSVVASNLNRILSRYADAHPDRCRLFFPRTAVWIPTGTYLEPDLFLVDPSRLTGPDPLTTADLVVEIFSPSTAVYDRTAKADTYAALGVRELWLVDLEKQTLEQRVLEGGAWRVAGRHAASDRFDAAAFPDLIIVLADVFAPAQPRV